MCLYVRDITDQETRILARWLRQSKSVVKMRRAQVVAFSAQGMKASEIAAQLGMHQEYIRKLIREFNTDGFDALKPRKRTGRSPALTEEEKAIVVEVATAPPQAFGRPFNQWSLRKLHKFLVQDKELIARVSVGTIRNVLKAKRVSYQCTRTWKQSNDPDYDAKKNESSDSTKRHRRTVL